MAWPDECIYLAGARNVVERGTLATNFYVTHSLLRRGHPHRDVHMPGYVLALAPFVAARGATFAAGAALNLVLFLAAVPLVYALARGILQDRAQAALAAGLFTLLPPFPGYLFVVYPEMLATLALLAALTSAVHARGVAGAALAGVLFALGALVRETLLIAAPVCAARLDRRQLLRGFVPAALATLVLIVAPFSRDRAVHPNALYPSVLEEARRSPSPVATFAGAVWKNVQTNLKQTAEADPTQRAEDAVLAFLLLLAAAGAAGARCLRPAGRRLALATLVSLALLTMAVLALYVVRERGGVWGGVRAYMAWAPLLLVLATPLLFVPRRPALRAVLVLAVAAGFFALDRWQVAFFNRYKASDLEDQTRHARYIERYVDPDRPRRIVSRSFTYGLSHWPVEVVWSLPRDAAELRALEKVVSFEFVAHHERHPLRYALMGNPRYLRVNKEDKGAELLIWRRLE